MRKNDFRSGFFKKELISALDDRKPMFSMTILAQAVVQNCFAGKYQFRTEAMRKRLSKHGVLPKSFFRESFIRSTKLMKLMDMNDFDLDKLVDHIVDSEFLEPVEMLDRKENKIFYKLRRVDENGC